MWDSQVPVRLGASSSKWLESKYWGLTARQGTLTLPNLLRLVQNLTLAHTMLAEDRDEPFNCIIFFIPHLIIEFIQTGFLSAVSAQQEPSPNEVQTNAQTTTRGQSSSHHEWQMPPPYIPHSARSKERSIPWPS